ncbi:MAG: hypothetical protein ACTTKS_00005 [Bulleidia sp.]
MCELNTIIKKIEDNINRDDFEMVMMDCMEDIKRNHNQLASVKPLLQLMERNPLIHFGDPGAIVHFVETFYKKGYEEELVDSIKRKPALHTVWMLNRLINGADNKEYYLSLLKEICKNKLNDKKIRDEALYFLSIH